MADYKRLLKRLIIFEEPQNQEEFILKENRDETETNSEQKDSEGEGNQVQKDSSEDKKNNKKRGMLKKLFNPFGGDKGGGEGKEDRSGKPEKEVKVSRKLSENLAYIKKRYTIPQNSDVVLREFNITVRDKSIGAFILFFDGMTDRKVVDDNILSPLMLLSNLDIKEKEDDIALYVKDRLLPQNQLKMLKEMDGIIDEINFGGCGLFIDGIDWGFAADVKGWEHRSVDRPNTELVLRGPQEGFTEVLRINTALIRKTLKDEDLIVEGISIGERSKTPCSLLFIKDIANEALVDEVRKRLKSIKIDYLLDSGQLEQLIEDSAFLPAPQVISTERPDRVAAMLTEGKAAVIAHGSPFALVMPATQFDLLHSSEDSYIRFPYANFLRAIRIAGILLSLLLPGFYIAITNFHQEMIPTDLLLAIEASREKVPFPTIVEILIMESAFELIREAGIRIPGPIGPTLGIIGALILGQAAVAANIVSPILIIIVAVTGIGSFANPNFSLAFAFRILRFFYIILGSTAGFLGITTGIFVQGLWFVHAKSFGVPFMAPFAPKTTGNMTDTLTRAPMWNQEERPDYLNTKDPVKQPEISRKWTKKSKDDKGESGKNEK